MTKELPCYIVSDLIPLYQEDILSEKTKTDIENHLKECEDCKKTLDAMNVHIDVMPATLELKHNPFKKIKFYQKVLTILGAFIAFIFGACSPVVTLGIGVLARGGITDYQLERLQHLWHLLLLKCCCLGLAVCAVYLLIVFLIRKRISK